MDERNKREEAFPEVSTKYKAEDRFAFEQPYHEEAWEEEDIPLSGEINAADTFITGELFRDDPFEKLEGSSNLMEVSEDDPFDTFRADDIPRGSLSSGAAPDTNTEFAGELAPSPGMGTGFAASREDVTESRGDLQEDAPEGNKTFGWVSIILAIASLFYWPAVLGPVAAVFGVIAYIRGNRALGAWSVALGLLALLAFLFLVPYYS